MPQNVNPKPSTKGHPNVQAPAGTMLYDPATCDDGNGGAYLAYPIDHRPNVGDGGAPGRIRVRYVRADVAAEHLSWYPTDKGIPAPRLATDEEIATYRAAGGRP